MYQQLLADFKGELVRVERDLLVVERVALAKVPMICPEYVVAASGYGGSAELPRNSGVALLGEIHVLRTLGAGRFLGRMGEQRCLVTGLAEARPSAGCPVQSPAGFVAVVGAAVEYRDLAGRKSLLPQVTFHDLRPYLRSLSPNALAALLAHNGLTADSLVAAMEAKIAAGVSPLKAAQEISAGWEMPAPAGLSDRPKPP